MKISLKWLSEYIDIQDYFSKSADLAQLLTSAGIEVESVENRAKNFEHVVVGSILQKSQHPNADRLTLCQVSTGEGVVHQIVCGARNHKEGDRVVLALPGAVLPGNFAIKRSKIRDVESGGMLCSEKELGLKLESEEIMLLPADAPVGQSFAKFMGYDDILFELKVTPNRSDCLSHFGLAREIGALLGRPVRFPIESIIEDGGSTQDQVAIELRASELCPRYAGRGVTSVKVAPSPAWLTSRLESVGLKAINNVVDITNFVMMELGQPLHAFDIRELKGRKIIIDRAVQGETFTTLDGSGLKLDGTELTIRDTQRAVALAGIIGGKNSGIQDDTVEIFIEAAYFTPGAVRRTARRFGIETDSSYRFARGTNPEAVPLALNRAAQLVHQVAGGKVMGTHHDHYPNPIRREPIEISLTTVEARLGYKVDGAAFTQVMKRLDCQVEAVSGTLEKWRILPPMFRWDLALDMDLVEEFARLNGYQHIPETLPSLTAMPIAHDSVFLLEAKIRRLLQGTCLQAINYAFVSQSFQERILGDVTRLTRCGLNTPASDQVVSLMNPLNEELGVMRVGLVPGLLKNVIHNSRHGNDFGQIYEIGFGHFAKHISESVGESPGKPEKTYGQELRLAFANWGEARSLWQKDQRAPNVFSLKGQVETLLRGLCIDRFRWTQIHGKDVPEFIHPGQAAVLEIEDKPVGFIGSLHPSLAEELKIRDKTAVAEFNLDRLLAGQPKSPQFRRISKMPTVERDLAFLLPKELASSGVASEIRKVAGELLKDLEVFDVFSGGTLSDETKSVAFRLVFQALDVTLEDHKINEVRDLVVDAVTKKFSVTLR